MISKFKCSSCSTIFESEGRKEEYTSATYGPCFRYVAECPQCGAECSEYRAPQQKKYTMAPQPMCGAGNCCCKH